MLQNPDVVAGLNPWHLQNRMRMAPRPDCDFRIGAIGMPGIVMQTLREIGAAIVSNSTAEPPPSANVASSTVAAAAAPRLSGPAAGRAPSLVFAMGEGGYGCPRIPSAVSDPASGTVVIFAEGRSPADSPYPSNMCSDAAPHDLV